MKRQPTKHIKEVLPCYCGTTPELDREDNGECAYVCPACFMDTEQYSRDENAARRRWNSWIVNPRKEPS